MQIFPDDQHRLPLRLGQQPGDQGLLGLLLLPLGTQREGGIALWERQGEQRSKRGTTSGRGKRYGPQRLLQLGHLAAGIIALDTGGAAAGAQSRERGRCG